MAEKDGAVVAKAHAEGIKLTVSILEEFGLPLGLVPLADVIEVGFVRSKINGYDTEIDQQKKKVEHKFKLISKLVSYDTEINGYVQKNKIKKLKELMLWPPVSEITVDEPSTGKIHFKSFCWHYQNLPC